MNNYLIENVKVVNEGKVFDGYVLILNGIIEKVGEGKADTVPDFVSRIDGEGQFLLPGIIDDQVHFREPGLTHKATIKSESKAAVAGGVTSFMEMPNTNPQTTTIEALEKKYDIASKDSYCNYSFYLGATNDNIEEIKKLDPKRNCGIKVFMGSSTGNMLVDKEEALEQIFAEAPTLIATHCEDEEIIQNNTLLYKEKFGDNIAITCHPRIRSTEACYKSSSFAVALAKKFNTRLHVLHLSTEKEMELFEKGDYQSGKRITAEVCVHHLWFNDTAYETKGALVRWNPAVKTEQDRAALFQALLDDKLDVIATDHAPHTIEEKQNKYLSSASGGPMVQHSLTTMMEFVHLGRISIEKVVEKMCHAPAVLFNVKDRGFIREGYKADLVLVDPEWEWSVTHKNTYYKCNWSPLEGQVFHTRVTHSFVNGKLVFKNGQFNEMIRGERLEFH